MKKLLLLILALFFLVSCFENSDSIQISKEEYKKLKGDTLKPKYPKPFELYSNGLDAYGHGIVLGSDQHEYLVINHESNRESIEHYIDCQFCVEKHKESDIKIKYIDNER